MKIPYLETGDSPTAEKWNALFEEADRKISAVLGNKSLLTLDGAYFSLYGTIITKPFLFGEKKFHLSNLTSADLNFYENYGYPPTMVGSGYVVKSVDNARMIADIEDMSPHLAGSLIANKITYDGQSYWVRENGVIEKIHRYTSVDIIIEQAADNVFNFTYLYNKYNFFRFHNLNNFELEVRFRDGVPSTTHSIKIPAWQSKCVRRDSVTSGYIDGYQHLHKTIAGDPRLFRPRSDMMSNNVVNPWVVYDIIGLFDGKLPQPETALGYNVAPQVFCDPREYWDASEAFDGVFTSLANDHNIIGDCIHQHGKLLSIKTKDGGVETEEFNFNGYSTIHTDFAQVGLEVVEEDGALVVKNTDAEADYHDVAQIGTNIFSKSGDVITNSDRFSNTFVPLVDVKSEGYVGPATTNTEWRRIDNHLPEERIWPVDKYDVNVVIADPTLYTPSYTCNSAGVALTYTTTSLGYGSGTVKTTTLRDISTESPVTSFTLHSSTLADVKSLNCTGNPVYDAQNQESDYCTFSNVELVRTGAGVVLLAKQTVTLDYLYTDACSGGSTAPYVLNTGEWKITDGNLVRDNAILFSGYGFPYTYRTIDENGNDIDWKAPMQFSAAAFITPREHRRYGRLTSVFIGGESQNPIHADIWERNLTASSARTEGDFDFISLVENNTDSEYNPCCYKGFQTVGVTEGQIQTEFPVPNVDALLSIEDNLDSADFANWYIQERDRLLTDAQLPIREEANPDSWTEAAITIWENEVWRFTRIPLAIEHYNNLAHLINAIARFIPAREVCFKYWSETYSSVQRFPPPNTIGIFGAGSPRPKAQYCSFASGDATDLACQDLGISVKDYSDLPEILGFNEKTKTASVTISSLATISEYSVPPFDEDYYTDGIPSDEWDNLFVTHPYAFNCPGGSEGWNVWYVRKAGTGYASLGSPSVSTNLTDGATYIVNDYCANNGFSGTRDTAQQFYYCEIEDVIAVANALGVHFSIDVYGIPVMFSHHNMSYSVKTSYLPTLYLSGNWDIYDNGFSPCVIPDSLNAIDEQYSSFPLSDFLITSTASLSGNIFGVQCDDSDDFEWLLPITDDSIGRMTSGDISASLARFTNQSYSESFFPFNADRDSISGVLISADGEPCTKAYSTVYDDIVSLTYEPLCGVYGDVVTALPPGNYPGVVLSDYTAPELYDDSYPPSTFYWYHYSTYDTASGIVLYPQQFLDNAAENTGYSGKSYWHAAAVNAALWYPEIPDGLQWSPPSFPTVVRTTDSDPIIVEREAGEKEIFVNVADAGTQYKLMLYTSYDIPIDE